VASFDMYSLQRLATGMLSLCFACGKSREYEEILNAAVDSGISSINPEHFLERSSRRAICREWDHLHYEAYRYKRDTRTDQEKVQAFQERVKAIAQQLLPDKDSADIIWRHEQTDKPSPLLAGSASQSPDQTSAQALALWQQLHAKSQEDVESARTVARKWQAELIAQEKQMSHLKTELEQQKKLVRELAATNLNTQSPSLVETDTTDHSLLDRFVQVEQQLEVPQLNSDVLNNSTKPHSTLQEVEIKKIERDFTKNYSSSRGQSQQLPQQNWLPMALISPPRGSLI